MIGPDTALDHPRHVPVMVREVLEALAPRAGALYVDATFGAGGYACALLQAADCRVFGLDRDPEAVKAAAPLARSFSGRLRVLCGRFSAMAEVLTAEGVETVDGVAFDLGMSSMQVDAPERGFSFRADGPLDMRMGRDEAGPTAADVVNQLPEGTLTEILRTLGEERAARRIARAIVKARARSAFTRTAELGDVVRSVLPPVKRRQGAPTIDPATRTFQALRIYVNDELGELTRGLHAAERLLAPGGRLCVVSYHSLEDRAVKGYLRRRSGSEPGPSRHLPPLASPGTGQIQSGAPPARPPSFRLLSRRAVRPSAAEAAANPRARSARLRAAERTAQPPWPNQEGERNAA